MLAGDATLIVSDVSSLEVPSEATASKPRLSELPLVTTDLALSPEWFVDTFEPARGDRKLSNPCRGSVVDIPPRQP